MKGMKLFSALLCGAVLTGCGSSNAKSQDSEEKAEEAGSKVLVAYFSATGTTKAVAEKLAKDANATLFEIEPVQPYSEADLNWKDEKSRSSVEMKDKENSRPEIKNKVPDFEKYDVVFVGFPIWWYTCPTIINSFLESYDWKGKTIIPFATSGGSPIEPCIADMEKSAPGATIKDAKLLNNESDTAIQTWEESVLK